MVGFFHSEKANYGVKLMLKRLIAIVLFTQILTGCNVDLSEFEIPKLPDFLADIDIRIGLNGDVKTIVGVMDNSWPADEWVGVSLLSTLDGNSFVNNLDIVSVFQIGYAGVFKTIARTQCRAVTILDSDCAVAFHCMSDGETVSCETFEGNKFMPKADRNITFIPNGTATLRVISCNTNIVPGEIAVPKTCTVTGHSIQL